MCVTMVNEDYVIPRAVVRSPSGSHVVALVILELETNALKQ